MTEREEQNWMVFCHLSGLVFSSFLNVIIPLAIWIIRRKESDFIDQEGREVVNFQISITIYMLAALLMMFTIVGIPFAMIGILALFGVTIVSAIRGAMAASRGESFLYPINLRLLK